MIPALLLATALALAEPPPEPHAPIPGECPDIVAIRPGHPLPPEVDPDGDGIPDCGGSLLPASEHLDLLSWRSYAERAATRLELAEQRVALLERPPPLLERPAVARAIGRAETVLTVVLAAVVLDHLSDRSP